jgi:anti-anti-sigma regulatory factor
VLTYALAGRTLSIAGELQVQYLESLKDSLDQASTMPEPMTIDVSGVTEIDLAGLQMLLAFLRARKGAGSSSLHGIQPSVFKAMQIMGMDALLAEYLD